VPNAPDFYFLQDIQRQRQAVMSAAYAANPTRFTCGEPVVKGAPTAVYLNPPDQPENPS